MQRGGFTIGWRRRYLDEDMAPRCELDRIRQQVRDDMVQTLEVALKPRGHHRVEPDHQLQPLDHGGSTQLGARSPREVGCGEAGSVEGECTIVQAAVFKNVTDDGREGAARTADRLDAGPLTAVELGRLQQCRHAKHPVERRAQLVAHGGEELGLCLFPRSGAIQRRGQTALVAFDPPRQRQEKENQGNPDRRNAQGDGCQEHAPHRHSGDIEVVHHLGRATVQTLQQR